MLSKEKQDLYLYIYDKLMSQKPNSYDFCFCWYIAEYYHNVLHNDKYISNPKPFLVLAEGVLNDFPELTKYKPNDAGVHYWFRPFDIPPRLEIIKQLLIEHNIPYTL